MRATRSQEVMARERTSVKRRVGQKEKNEKQPDRERKRREREREGREKEKRARKREERKLSCKNNFLPSFENNSSGE